MTDEEIEIRRLFLLRIRDRHFRDHRGLTNYRDCVKCTREQAIHDLAEAQAHEKKEAA